MHGPPAYFTPDWDAARASVDLLACLAPEVAATGHGIAMHGHTLRTQLASFAARVDALARPKSGRYAQQPATADSSGVTSVPPPLVQPWLKVAAVAGLVLGGIMLAAVSRKKRRFQPTGAVQSPHYMGEHHQPVTGQTPARQRQPVGKY